MDTGERLKNGAVIIAATALKTGGFVVLANSGGPEPFVTWVVDERGGAHWGHYFPDLGQASFDYDQRVLSYKARGI